MKKHLLTIVYLCASTALSIAQTTTITLQPGPNDGKDAELFNCVPCGYDVRNFGNKKDLAAFAWTNNGDESNVRSLFQFDLTSIPAGAVITNARLSLYNNPTSQEGGHVSSFFHPNSSMIQRVTSPWDEQTVTWNTQPSVTKINKVLLHATTSSNQDFLNINVTKLVKDMINNPANSYGFMLRLRVEHQFKKLIFASSDNTNAAIRPKLVITYSGPAPRVKAPETTALKIDQALNQNISFEIFPNPVKDVLNISAYSNENSSASLKIYNVTGKEVYNRTLQLTNGSNQFPLQIVTWNKGIYFVLIKTTDKIISRKIIVE